jgi:hypothetical protein
MLRKRNPNPKPNTNILNIKLAKVNQKEKVNHLPKLLLSKD